MEVAIAGRHQLPEIWEFDGFSLQQFKKVFLTLQGMLFAWNEAKKGLADQLLNGGYKSYVWVVSKKELGKRLTQYTSVPKKVVNIILDLLTFGNHGIRMPDIALQPIIDLKNGFYALSPFVWMATDAERNLCVLINKIPAQRAIYSRLTNEKETRLITEITKFLGKMNLEFQEAKLPNTDVDLAIIDREQKACLCLELKWFIEPAEIRETTERSEELKTGVVQAKKIKDSFESDKTDSIKEKLQIDSSYKFLAVVASQNWIGHLEVQDDDVPIIKIWHLMEKIIELGSLSKAMEWLTERQYLPVDGVDYKAVLAEISCGPWKASWYGIKPLYPPSHSE